MKAVISPKHRWPYTRLHNTTSALKVNFNVPQNGPESTRCSLTHGYNILVHKFVYKANITTCPNYFKQAMILCHVLCLSVCRTVFVSMETKLKSQLHTITQPDGSNELHWNASLNGDLVLFRAYCVMMPLHSLKEALFRFWFISVCWQWINLKSTMIK